jgi:hypothetical protein
MCGRSLIQVLRVNRPNSHPPTIGTTVQVGTALTGTADALIEGTVAER